MDELALFRENIETVARLTQKAFLDIRKNLLNNTLSKEQKVAIASLPFDVITMSPENRLKKFPNDCCMDAANVLAIIFLGYAEQNGFEYGLIQQIRCRPTDKTKTRMFDFHQWLRVEGFHIDIAFEQCKTVLKGNEGKIVFDTHPLIGSDDYIFEGGNAVIEKPFAEFANFIIMNYIRGREK
jgi:hypothetical protein